MNKEPVHPFSKIEKNGNESIYYGGLTKRELFALHIYCSARRMTAEYSIEAADLLLSLLKDPKL